MDSMKAAGSSGGDGLPTPFDSMEGKASAESGTSPESASSGQKEADSGPTEGGLPPGLDELELSGGGPQGGEQQSSYNKRGKK